MKFDYKNFLHHIDKDEIIAKIISGIPSEEISEWLSAKYLEVNEQQFCLSKKYIEDFKKNYLDFYLTMQEDLAKTQTQPDQMQAELMQHSGYKNALVSFVETEVDIKTMARKALVNLETRLSQMFDILQEDPRNFRFDRSMVEYFNVFLTYLEKMDTIVNGQPGQNQINIQNNINLNVLDQHIGQISDIIREILEQLDYDKSLIFIDKLNSRLSNLNIAPEIIPQEERLQQMSSLQQTISTKLDK